MPGGNVALVEPVSRCPVLKERVVTALVMLLLVFLDIFWFPRELFALSLGLLAAAAGWEWGRMAGLTPHVHQSVYATAVGLAALVFVVLPINTALVVGALLAASGFWLYATVQLRNMPVRPPIERAEPGLLLTGGLLLVATVVAVQYLRFDAVFASPWLLLYALAIVWLMDIGAYFTGRKFGNRKLSPEISPGKTWEGVWGGLGFTVLAVGLVVLWIDMPAGYGWRLVLASVPAAGLSVVGDLYESRIKRAAGVKDSGRSLPGHGGLLDRIDGVLAAVPVFAAMWWLMGLSGP